MEVFYPCFHLDRCILQTAKTAETLAFLIPKTKKVSTKISPRIPSESVTAGVEDDSLVDNLVIDLRTEQMSAISEMQKTGSKAETPELHLWLGKVISCICLKIH